MSNKKIPDVGITIAEQMKTDVWHGSAMGIFMIGVL